MLLEAETNKYCPGGYDIGAISNLITWVLNFFLSVCTDKFFPKGRLAYDLFSIFRYGLLFGLNCQSLFSGLNLC